MKCRANTRKADVSGRCEPRGCCDSKRHVAFHRTWQRHAETQFSRGPTMTKWFRQGISPLDAQLCAILARTRELNRGVLWFAWFSRQVSCWRRKRQFRRVLSLLVSVKRFFRFFILNRNYLNVIDSFCFLFSVLTQTTRLFWIFWRKELNIIGEMDYDYRKLQSGC